MFYLGGKATIGEDISRAIRAHSRKRAVLVEPFLGGGNSYKFLAPFFQEVRIGDIHADLILMWKAVAAGWVPPHSVIEAQYRQLRHAEPSALRGFVGFGCSFGAKWFGGYARTTKGSTDASHYTRKAAQDVASLARYLPPNKLGTLAKRSYDEYHVDRNCVVYADPPYRGTTEYSREFGHAAFWQCMERYAKAGADVFVSEYNAPEEWEPIWAGSKGISINRGLGNGARVQEKLFTYKGER